MTPLHPYTRTVVYDLETSGKFAPYCEIKLCGLLWDDGTEEIYQWPLEPSELCTLQAIFASPNIRKVSFNNSNYDDLVLYHAGIPVCDINREDGFLAAKTLWPELPAFSLKFLNWYLFGDFHLAEYEFQKSQQTKGLFGDARFSSTDPHDPLFVAYLSHDLYQHKTLWEYMEPLLVGPAIEAYRLDLSQGKVVEMMTFRGGLYIDAEKARTLLARLEHAKAKNLQNATVLSEGRIKNAGSGKQVGAYFDAEGIEMELTEKGEFQVDKDLIEDLWRLHPVAHCVRKIRKCDSIIKYYRNYLKALEDPTYAHKPGWIPTSFSISGARTRRYTSSSRYKLNFQNPSHSAKRVQTTPIGFLSGWIDATQVENVVHIYESNDKDRRRAYEADINWSEYVWLCNMVLGQDLTKKQLDAIQSPHNPLWSVYKQYKTIKLMMNFGSGVKRFCDVAGFAFNTGKKLFEDIHRACPAIRRLAKRIQEDWEKYGEVRDPFGHVYRCTKEKVYKLVAFLIQGCGTGSLPKAQLRANYDVFEEYNKRFGRDVAVLTVTTHDECGFMIDLSIGEELVEEILMRLMFNMTKKFSYKFVGIPLRAKMYLSTTTNIQRKEVGSYAEFKQLQNAKI